MTRRLLLPTALAVFVALGGCQSLLNFTPTGDPGVPAVDANATDVAAVDAAVSVTDARSDAPASSYAALVLADQPLFYFRLSETSGLRAVDSSGNGRDGAYVGAVLRDRPGAIASDPDRAVALDGTAEQHIKVQQPISRAAEGPFTIEAWVWPTRPSETPFDIIADDVGWLLFSQGNVLKFERMEQRVWFPAGLRTDGFTHVVGTYDGKTMALYLDGLNVGELESLPTGVTNAGSMLAGAHFPGTLDELAYYDHALSRERIGLHYQRGSAGP